MQSIKLIIRIFYSLHKTFTYAELQVPSSKASRGLVLIRLSNYNETNGIYIFLKSEHIVNAQAMSAWEH